MMRTIGDCQVEEPVEREVGDVLPAVDRCLQPRRLFMLRMETWGQQEGDTRRSCRYGPEHLHQGGVGG